MGKSSRTPPKVAVLMGGPSAEREVSLSSGRECAQALRGEGFEVVEIGWGEDGCVQGLLEWMGLPYTHSGVLASALAMDKERAKQVFRDAGLPVVESVLAGRDAVEAAHVMDPPYVVKPNNEGSSVGIYIVNAGANTPPKLSKAMPDTVMVETFAPGRELTTAVMGDRALCVTDILTDGWYDYDAKYKEGGSRHVLPADIPAEIEAACLDHALRAHQALGCRGVSRTDFRWDETRGLDGLIILEVNTQPGMTPTSLVPEQAAYLGMSFGQICAWMVEDASCNR